jgi:hypothetical protein
MFFIHKMQSLKAGLEAVLKAPEYLTKPCAVVASVGGATVSRPFKVGLFLAQFVIDFCSRGGISNRNSSLDLYSIASSFDFYSWKHIALASLIVFTAFKLRSKVYLDFKALSFSILTFILSIDAFMQFSLRALSWIPLEVGYVQPVLLTYLNNFYPDALVGSHVTCALFMLLWYFEHRLEKMSVVIILQSTIKLVADNEKLFLDALKASTAILTIYLFVLASKYIYLDDLLDAVRSAEYLQTHVLIFEHQTRQWFRSLWMTLTRQWTATRTNRFRNGAVEALASLTIGIFWILEVAGFCVLFFDADVSFVFCIFVAGISLSLECISKSAAATEAVIKFAKLFIAEENYQHGLICCAQLAVLDILRRAECLCNPRSAVGGVLVYSAFAFFYFSSRLEIRTSDDVLDIFKVYSLPFMKFYLWNVMVVAVFQSNLPGYGTFSSEPGFENFLYDLVHLLVFNPMIIEISKGLGSIAKLLTSTSSLTVKHTKRHRWELALLTVKVMLCMYCLLFVGMYACRLAWMNFTSKTSTQHPFYKLSTLCISAFCVLFGLTTFIQGANLRADDSFAEIFFADYRQRKTLSGVVAHSVKILEENFRIGELPKKILSAASDDCVICLESLSALSSADLDDDLDMATKIDKLQALGTKVFHCGHATHVDCWNMWIQQQQRQRTAGPRKCLCCQAAVD